LYFFPRSWMSSLIYWKTKKKTLNSFFSNFQFCNSSEVPAFQQLYRKIQFPRPFELIFFLLKGETQSYRYFNYPTWDMVSLRTSLSSNVGSRVPLAQVRNFSSSVRPENFYTHSKIVHKTRNNQPEGRLLNLYSFHIFFEKDANSSSQVHILVFVIRRNDCTNPKFTTILFSEYSLHINVGIVLISVRSRWVYI